MVRENIDYNMLQKVFPVGEAILRDVIQEYRSNGVTFGRQLGTYPILIGTKQELEIGKPSDMFVTDYGYRSITGLKYPFDINNADIKELEELPGVGKKRAKNIVDIRPIKTKDNLQDILAENYQKLEKVIKI